MQVLPSLCVEPSEPRGVLVVDDHELVRLGLYTLVESHAASSGRNIPVFETSTLQEAVSLYHAKHDQIGLVLLDLHLPDAHGLSGLTTFIGRFPAARVVVLSGNTDPAMVRDALALGASGYLAKTGGLEHVVGYIRSPGPQEQASEPDGRQPTDSPGDATGVRIVRTCTGESVKLSNRQAQVLDWILAGQSNREIAELAHLSEGTVKNHVSTLLLMFGVRSRAQLISQLR